MDEVPLSDDLKEKFYTFIDTDPRITSLHTVKSYKFIAEKVFDNYDSISKDTIRAILKRYGKRTNVKAMLTKLNECFLDEGIDYTIRFRKGKRPPRKIPDILSKQELIKILNTMPDVYRMMISCIYNIGSGLRISELINLEWANIQWDQLSLDNPIIDVTIKNSKRGKSRTVPMAKESAIALIKYANEVGAIGTSGYPEGGRIFDFGEDSFKKDLKIIDIKQWDYEYVQHSYDWILYNIFKKYFKSVANKNITPHSLRHSRATELLNEHDVPIQKISKWLGHDDISTTMIYLRIGNKNDRELMEKIGGV